MFHTTFTIEVAQLAKATKNGATLRVFLLLPAYLSYTQFRSLRGEQIAEALDINRRTVTTAMEELLQLGAVERRGRKGGTQWKLTPDYGWNGDVASYHAEQRKRGKAAPPTRKPGLRSHNEDGGKPVVSGETRNKTAPPKAQRSLTLLSPIPGGQ